jgi:anti-sigma28 factor (negative regulator of flagellin synthesis)
MRLHLDTGSTAGAADTSNASSPLAGAAKPSSGLNTSAAGNSTSQSPNLQDNVAVSSASNAWSASFSDRSARVAQLTAAVQGGTYRVSSAAVSQSIVASAATA